jgi:hypothetical protein
MQFKPESEFVNPKPDEGIIQSGDSFAIVHDETKTAADIMEYANNIHAYRDLNGVRWYFVLWSGLQPIRHWEFDKERLEFFVATLTEERRKHAN